MSYMKKPSEQSQLGLFTFYKQEQQYERYLQLLEKQKKNHKSKSKSKSKNKSKHKYSKSKKKLNKQSNYKSQSNQSGIVSARADTTNINNTNASINVDARQKFLRKIIDRKINGHSFIMQKSDIIQNSKRILLTQSNQQTTITKSSSSLLPYQHLKSITKIGPSASEIRLPPHLHNNNEEQQNCQSKTTPHTKKQKLKEMVHGMHGKVRSNFFKGKTQNRQLQFQHQNHLNIRISNDNNSTSRIKNKKQNRKQQSSQPYRVEKNKPQQQKFKLPVIKKIRMSRQLNNINQLVKKNLTPIYRYNSTKSKKKLQKNNKSNSNIHINKSEKIITVMKTQPKAKRYKQVVMQISKINLDESPNPKLYNQWEIHKKSLMKKLGL